MNATSLSGVLISRFLLTLRQVYRLNIALAGHTNSPMSSIRFAPSIPLNTLDGDVDDPPPLGEADEHSRQQARSSVSQ